MENYKDYFEEIYGYVPDYFIRSDKESVTVRILDVNNKQEDKIVTIKDVISYLNTYQYDNQSTVRILGNILGEHKVMNVLTVGCYEYFKLVNLSGLREMAKQYKFEINVKEM